MEPKTQNDEVIPVLEEAPGPHGDLALGEVMQIPTVEELQQESPLQQVYVENENPVYEEEREPEPTPIVEEDQQEIQQPPSFPIEESGPFIERESEPDYEEFEEEDGSSWKKILLIVALFVIIAAGAAFYFYQKSNSDKTNATPKPSTKQAPPPMVNSEPQNLPPVQPPTETPAPTPENQVGPGEVVHSSALQLAAAGNLADASKMWRQDLSKQKNSLTIQVEIACQTKTIMEAIDLFGSTAPVYVVPLNYKGQACYRVLYGTYKSEREAAKDLATLPAEFLQQPSPPKVIPVWKALQ